MKAFIVGFATILTVGQARADVWAANKVGGLTASSNDRDSGWGLSVACAPKSGFSFTLVLGAWPTERFTSAAAKVANGRAIDLTVHQDPSLPVLVQLTGGDRLQDEFLSKEEITLKLGTAGADRIIRFPFPGVSASAAKIKKLCPPF